MIDPEKEEDKVPIESQNMISQSGKTVEEIMPYLLSGEPDD